MEKVQKLTETELSVLQATLRCVIHTNLHSSFTFIIIAYLVFVFIFISIFIFIFVLMLLPLFQLISSLFFLSSFHLFFFLQINLSILTSSIHTMSIFFILLLVHYQQKSMS